MRRLPVRVNGIEEGAHGAVALEIAFSGCTDAACVSHKDFDADLEFGTHSAWGHLAFSRMALAGTATLSFEHTAADGVWGR